MSPTAPSGGPAPDDPWTEPGSPRPGQVNSRADPAPADGAAIARGAGIRGARRWIREQRRSRPARTTGALVGLGAATSAELWVPVVAGSGIAGAVAVVAAVSGDLMAHVILDAWGSWRGTTKTSQVDVSEFHRYLEGTFERLLSPDQTRAVQLAFEGDLARLVTNTAAADQTGTAPELHAQVLRSLSALTGAVTTGHAVLLDQIQAGQDRIEAYIAHQQATAAQLLHLEQQTRADLGRLLWQTDQPTARPTGPGPPPPTGPPPYPGLRPFGPAESAAGYFHGRQDTVAAVLTRLAVLAGRAPGVLIVTGPSGVGKTSLLHAGVLPALAAGLLPVPGSQNWPVIALAPGSRPLRQLAVHTTTAAGVSVAGVAEQFADGPGHLDDVLGQVLHHTRSDSDPTADRRRVLIVVDQAEELFTQGCPAAEREAFLAGLLHAAGVRPEPDPAHPGPPDPDRADPFDPAQSEDRPNAVVLISFRADFYSFFAAEESLAAHLEQHQIVVSALNRTRLRQIIEQPARQAGLRVETGLVTALLDDSTRESLPLLAHALRQLYDERQGDTLTLSAYRTMGGLAEALADTAEQLYESLSPDGRSVLHQLLLSLISIGDGVQDTRHNLPIDETLEPFTDDPGLARRVLTRLTDARLVTTDQGTCALSHEAIITAWPRLQSWLAEDRAGLRLHQELRRAAALWNRRPTDTAELWVGSRLDTLETWSRTRRAALTPLDRRFVDASLAHRRALASTDRRRSRNLRIIAAVVTVMLVAVGALTVVAYGQRGAARRAQNVDLAGQLITTAEEQMPSNGPLAGLLALEADRLHPSTATRAMLARVGQAPMDIRLTGQRGVINDAVFSPDGSLLASASDDGAVLVWDTSTGQIINTFGDFGYDTDVAFSPDGRRIAVVGTGLLSIQILDPRSGERFEPIGLAVQEFTKVAYSPDGTVLAAATEDRVTLWDTDTGQSRGALPVPEDAFSHIAFAPQGSVLAVGGGQSWSSSRIDLWDVSENRRIRSFRVPFRVGGGMAFSRDGSRLVTVQSGGHTVYVIDVATAELELTLPFENSRAAQIGSPGFGPDGLLAVPDVGQVSIIDPDTGSTQQVLLDDSDVEGLLLAVFSPDGSSLVTVGRDHTMRLWDMAAPSRMVRRTNVDDSTSSYYSPPGGVLLGPDLHTVAVYSGAVPFRLTQVDAPGQTVDLTGFTPYRPFASVVDQIPGVFSPDGTRLVALGQDGGARIWDTETGDMLGRTEILDEADDLVAVDPSGRYLATLATVGGSDADLLRISDTDSAATVADLEFPAESSIARAIALGPGLDVVATGHYDGNVRLWRVRLSGDGMNVVSSITAGPVLAGHTASVNDVAVSPDGRLVASAGDDGLVLVWDAVEGTLVHALTGHEGTVTDIAFHPEGTMLASSGSDDTVRLWSIETGTQLQRMPGAWSNDVYDLQFNNSGTALGAVTGGTLLQWSLRATDPDDLCDRIGRNLTQAEWERYLTGDHRTTCPVRTGGEASSGGR